MAEPIQMPFVGLTGIGQKNRSLRKKGQFFFGGGVSGPLKSSARKNDRTARHALGGADFCGSKEPLIRWGQDRTNPFAAARGGRMTMRRFVKILRPLVVFTSDSWRE